MSGNFLRSFEEITNVYGGFLFREDFLQAGTAALKECEEDILHAPAVKDGNICFTVSLYPYFEDDDLIDIAQDCGYDVETAEEAKAVIPEDAGIMITVDVTISLKEVNGRMQVGDVKGKYVVVDHEGKRADDDYQIELDDDLDCGGQLERRESVDDDFVFAIIETFLDAAVDAE